MVVNAALLKCLGPRGVLYECLSNNTFTRGMIWRTLYEVGPKGPTQCFGHNNSCRFESDLNMNGPLPRWLVITNMKCCLYAYPS